MLARKSDRATVAAAALKLRVNIIYDLHFQPRGNTFFSNVCYSFAASHLEVLEKPRPKSTARGVSLPKQIHGSTK
jgi:hypothetical protein